MPLLPLERQATGNVTTANAGITSVSIDAATDLTASSLAIGTNAGTQSLTITGAGDVSLGTLDTDFASIDASGSTGGLTATLSATSAATLTGGSGNDVITTSATAQTGAINAGDGTDVLVVGATTLTWIPLQKVEFTPTLKLCVPQIQ